MKTNLRLIKILVLCVAIVVVTRVVEAQQVIVDHSSKFDEFSGSNWESAMGRLDNFALDMRNNPHMVGVLIVCGGQGRRRGEARTWTGCLKSYLVTRRGIEPNRILMINGGYREDLTVELWETADRKRISNPEPHVKPKDVRFRNGKVKRLCEI